MIRSAVANKARHDEKLKKCQENITTYLPVRRDRKPTTHSATATPYISCTYVQKNLEHLYENREETAHSNRMEGLARRFPPQPQAQAITHRKVKFARITAFLNWRTGNPCNVGIGWILQTIRTNAYLIRGGQVTLKRLVWGEQWRQPGVVYIFRNLPFKCMLK